MVEAIFIKNNNTKYICNICSEQIDNDKIIGLKCNPSKHIFCYNCILDWYKELRDMKNDANYDMYNMCPICREKGGYLPLYCKEDYIKGIHILKNKNRSPKCGVKLSSKNSFCQLIGKPEYNNLCDKHFHLAVLKNKIVINECGFKCSTNQGYCKFNGKPEYNNYCKMHYNKIKKDEDKNKKNIDENTDKNTDKNTNENTDKNTDKNTNENTNENKKDTDEDTYKDTDEDKNNKVKKNEFGDKDMIII